MVNAAVGQSYSDEQLISVFSDSPCVHARSKSFPQTVCKVKYRVLLFTFVTERGFYSPGDGALPV